MYDIKEKAVWIIGAVEEVTREVILEIVPNRKKTTFLAFFKKYICDKAVVKTDGHRSYPAAVAGIEGKHLIVNHEEGFKNKEGHHTNLIECEWSHFKADIKTRKGIPGFAIRNYIEEYIWRRRNIKKNFLEFKISIFKNYFSSSYTKIKKIKPYFLIIFFVIFLFKKPRSQTLEQKNGIYKFKGRDI
ncbi:hypothetical protein DMUE_1653 [Dictyocoela muelleri]|nr:hypothetical protein DMUE_1653 [Dictyocoela muelleri]